MYHKPEQKCPSLWPHCPSWPLNVPEEELDAERAQTKIKHGQTPFTQHHQKTRCSKQRNLPEQKFPATSKHYYLEPPLFLTPELSTAVPHIPLQAMPPRTAGPAPGARACSRLTGHRTPNRGTGQGWSSCVSAHMPLGSRPCGPADPLKLPGPLLGEGPPPSVQCLADKEKAQTGSLSAGQTSVLPSELLASHV